MKFPVIVVLSSWLIVIGLVGCASPPSVTPLMRVVQQTLEREEQLLEVDRQRQETLAQQQRRAIDDAFLADLQNQVTLEPDWVETHARVYATARESLLRHELERQHELDARQDNLRHASEAQLRAMGLLERQDELLRVVPDLRRWLQSQTEKGENR